MKGFSTHRNFQICKILITFDTDRIQKNAKILLVLLIFIFFLFLFFMNLPETFYTRE